MSRDPIATAHQTASSKVRSEFQFLAMLIQSNDFEKYSLLYLDLTGKLTLLTSEHLPEKDAKHFRQINSQEKPSHTFGGYLDNTFLKCRSAISDL